MAAEDWGLRLAWGLWTGGQYIRSSGVVLVWGRDSGCVVSPRPHAEPPLHTGRGGARTGAERRVHRDQLLAPRRVRVWQDTMGLEKEKSDTSIIMAEDEFNRSIEPILSKKGKVYAAEPDRDPNDLNAHLKVKSAPCAECVSKWNHTTSSC